MTDHPAPELSDEIPAELVHVRNTVACELSAQLALRGETIDLAAACEVAHAVAVRLGREFRIDRIAAQQADLNDDDSLGPDGAAFYGSAGLNENGQESHELYPIFDYRWPSRS